MISVSCKPDEAEIQVSTPDDAVLGQHRAGLRDVPGRTQPAALKEDVDFVHNTDELRGLPQTLSVPKFSPHLPRRVYIMVPTTLSNIYLCIYLPDRLWPFQGRN